MVKSLTLLEAQAARIVEKVTDCSCSQLDPGGGPNQLPDFEIRNGSNERMGVLEVTSTVNSALAAFRNAQAKIEVPSDQLHFDWFIVMRSTDAKLKVLRRRLPPLLLQAEEKGFLPPPPMELLEGVNFVAGDEPQTSLCAEGVSTLWAWPRHGSSPGTVHIQPPAVGGGIGLEMVTAAVEAELGKQDNLAKLATAAVGERSELFVWLDEGLAAMALVTPRILPQYDTSFPKDGPRLPTPVTKVWVATGPNDSDVLARALWVADGGKWEVVDPPARLG